MFESIRQAARHLASPAGAFALVISVLCGVIVADGQLRAPAEAARSADAAQSERRVLQDGSDWLSENYWARKRARRLNQQYGYFSPESNPFDERPVRQRVERQRPASAPTLRSDGRHYRTVCVRLCDGYYFPISFSTTSDRFDEDEKVCQSKCSADVRLFYHPSDEPDATTLKDREGRDYVDLANAFVYRTRYQASCQCRPDPWSEAARQRHAMYATEEWQEKAVQVADGEEPPVRGSASSASRVRVVRAGDAAEDAQAARVDEDQGTAAVVERSVRAGGSASGRMSLGARNGRQSNARPRVVRREDRSWRRRVFNTLTE